jgi:transposase-like protein
MNIIEVYQKFPTQQDCINHLEKVRWNNEPICPYCKSKNQTPMKKENRYHCNTCNTSYSVMVGTIFENTKLDFQKWFLAISLMLNAKKGISARQLARDIDVNKNTAWYVLMRLRNAMTEYSQLLQGIIEVDETYIGGLNKNRHSDKKTKGGQGRGGEDKTPVIGMKQRNGNIIAKKAKDVRSKTLNTFINAHVKPYSTLMTDEFRGYNKLSKKYNHQTTNHSAGQYVNGQCHTNGMENFWSLLKRGIVGQYHYVTNQYLDKYITEFSFRQNNRTNGEVFELILQRSLNAM